MKSRSILTITLTCICLILTGCRYRNHQEWSEYACLDSSKIYFLNFEQNLKNPPTDTFVINSIAKNITFVPLETSSTALLSIINFMVHKINDCYYVSSMASSTFSGIIEFDSTGRFKNHLVQVGRGPKELSIRFTWSYNNNTQQLVASSPYEMLLHSFEKSSTKKYSLTEFFFRGYPLNDGTFVGLPSIVGTGETDTPYLSFLDREGVLIKSLYYTQKRNSLYNLMENQGDVGPLETYGLYPSYAGDALFKDMFNDTIYRVRSMDDIEPYIIIHRGLLTPKVKESIDRAAKAKTVIIRGILDSEKYVFVLYGYRNAMYNAIWDKQTQMLIANTEADYRNNTAVINNTGFTKYRTPNGNEILIGISNIFDGKLYCALRASQAMEFLPDIDEYDNPVLMVIELQ